MTCPSSKSKLRQLSPFVQGAIAHRYRYLKRIAAGQAEVDMAKSDNQMSWSWPERQRLKPAALGGSTAMYIRYIRYTNEYDDVCGRYALISAESASIWFTLDRSKFVNAISICWRPGST